ncbi:hypothetical protein P153DRAFT_362127 [Dothidotthia symphoricarpi CBS 119687]|uniref:Cora-domain-containing protein n=1 Tax=Dothidotthia symphoricarpi CBS 119687 TaxID=1392245 RepID=A0A6A6ARB7_9PLEO|nr:uncharacterized protein P153DRAFT_362127 [Dothidotthia symphoricarpi CBS 119687]KAF2134360.1 hypothetical protein P153DRAFT_362127 [Dothidotthia symphoricarpi CBS 119687]
MSRSKSDPPRVVVEDTDTDQPPMDPPKHAQTTSTPTSSTSTSTSTHVPAPPIRDRRKRKHISNIEWHLPWTRDSWDHGRVLLIDYVAQSHTTLHRRKIMSQEFSDIHGLRRFYNTSDLSSQAALRVIHVQNAPWATHYLLRKFNIDANDDLVGTAFGRWARYERPQMRGGKPVLGGKTFRAQRDPWRGIGRTAFGCEYLRYYDKGSVGRREDEALKIMELNRYDEDDMPCYGFDVHVQRLSVYVQLNDGTPVLAVDPDIPNPYDEDAYLEYQRLKKQYGNVDADKKQNAYIPKLRSLDNGNTIIIFETSPTGSVKDTLIGARQELESRWRRLTFYLPRENMNDDSTLATECMDFILRDIFKAVAFSWEKFLSICETHVGILEDKIYENPADESRAPELWKNSSLWLKVERLLYIHVDIVKEMRAHLYELANANPTEDEKWLGSVPGELERLPGVWERDVVLPTSALSDLMYKSVGIRDARHSLQLGLSMWRLSWITFIFLPLTFTVGFFGMNVSTFADPMPPIKYWFISSVPILFVVLILWYGVKHTLASQRQSPMRRGVYEALYNDLATSHPSLWTRRGPQSNIVPVGWWGSLKWRLIKSWFNADRLLLTPGYDPAVEEFGALSRVKRALVRRWLPELAVMPAPAVVQQNQQQPSLESVMNTDLGAVGNLLAIATPVAIAEFEPSAAKILQKRMPVERLRSLSPARSEGSGSGKARASSDAGMEGVMVEEKGTSEDEKSGDERPQRLGVPGLANRV